MTLATSWDTIVVGAGSAGAAAATTLARQRNGSVLLLEAGKPDNWHWFRIPIGVAHLLLGSRGLERYFTAPQRNLHGRRIFWPRGTGPGGSSRVNGMIWARGDPAEYDRWAADGLGGWAYADLLPGFQAIERYGAAHSRTRGREGPVPIATYSPLDPLTEGFLRACQSMGWPMLDDYNDGGYEGAGLLQLNTQRGLRVSTNEAFLEPARSLANFALVCDALVTRITLEGRRATGVTCMQDGRRIDFTARREVVLCAGAIRSPQLLELSGIGDAARLRRLGIAVAHHVPAVGEALADHLHVRVNLRARGAQTVNDLQRSLRVKLAQGLRFALRRDGFLSTATCTAHALVRSAVEDPQPDVKLQLHLVTSPDARDPARYVLDPFPGFSIAVFQLRPHARGSVHIDNPDPHRHPVIEPNYLGDSRDAATTLRGLRLARRLAAQPALSRYVDSEIRPGPTADSDEALLDHARATGTTSYHPVGTCRMGPPGAAVVDARLRVHGIEALRVADASIMPSLPSSNTNAPAIMIGHKAATLIGEHGPGA